MIVSNPPYVSSGEYVELAPEVREHEPRIALEGGKDGMRFLEIIIREAKNFLTPGGWMILEMDPGQTGNVLRFMNRELGYEEGRRIKDYSHRYRSVVARKTP
jgi:release factor glutamine methyltransferase